MLKVIMCCGIPASGKSSWAKAEIAKDPLKWIRINNDQLREMANGAHYSSDYEKIISSSRNHLVREALKRGLSVIIDNVNLNKKHFDEMVKISEEMNLDIEILEKPFYIELEEAISRDAKREGSAKVGEAVIKKFYKDSGKEQFKFYKPRHTIITKRSFAKDRPWEPLKQNETLDKAVICDLDGSIAEISHRSPYDASKCLNDTPIKHVVEMVKLFYNNGYKIIFCSGREDKFRDLTSQWLDKHVNIQYDLFMRPSNNFEKDALIKERIFNAEIKDKYNVCAVIDDRLQVCQLWYKLSLPIFRVGDPDASF